MIGDVFSNLKGAALYVAGAIVLALVGAATYLASRGTLSGQDWLTIIVPVLTGVVGITSAHVAGQTAASAFNTPAPIPPAGVNPPPAAGGVPTPEVPA